MLLGVLFWSVYSYPEKVSITYRIYNVLTLLLLLLNISHLAGCHTLAVLY